MSNAGYVLYTGYISSSKFQMGLDLQSSMGIEVQIDALLAQRGRTFYWLSKQTGISHTTLWRLKKGKALGINFETLKKICEALGCQPGDVLKLENLKLEKGK